MGGLPGAARRPVLLRQSSGGGTAPGAPGAELGTASVASARSLSLLGLFQDRLQSGHPARTLTRGKWLEGQRRAGLDVGTFFPGASPSSPRLCPALRSLSQRESGQRELAFAVGSVPAGEWPAGPRADSSCPAHSDCPRASTEGCCVGCPGLVMFLEGPRELPSLLSLLVAVVHWTLGLATSSTEPGAVPYPAPW